jgi:hypothetical protein
VQRNLALFPERDTAVRTFAAAGGVPDERLSGKRLEAVQADAWRTMRNCGCAGKHILGKMHLRLVSGATRICLHSKRSGQTQCSSE